MIREPIPAPGGLLMRTALLTGIGCLLLFAFSQAAPGARVTATGAISGTASWTATSSTEGTLTMSWSGGPNSISDGFILVNDNRQTTSTRAGDMLVSPCPRNTCNAANGAGFDFFTLVGQQGGSGTDKETMDVPKTGHWYVQFEAEQPLSSSQCPAMCLSEIIDVPAQALVSKGQTGGGTTGTSSGASNKAVQVAEGYAVLTRGGAETKCTESSCPVQDIVVGDRIATGANSYILIKSKEYGLVRVGPHTKFTIEQHFADLEGGSIEYAQVQHQVLEHLYVAPPPALNYVGGKPKGYTAGVQAVGGANLDAYVSTSSAPTTTRRVAAGGAAKTVTVDVISGSAKVSDGHGHTRVVTAGHEQQLVGGKLKQPTTYKQASCDAASKGYGAFCGNGGATNAQPLPDGTIAPFSGYFYCCWAGANLKVAWTQGGNTLQMSWVNPGPHYLVSMIYLGTGIRAPGLLWPGDLWRHYWDPYVPNLTSFTLTRSDYESQPEVVTWPLLKKEAGLYFQVSWDCGILYNDRQAGITCGDPVPGQAFVDLWSTLVKVPAG
jgi:hypothetical protein